MAEGTGQHTLHRGRAAAPAELRGRADWIGCGPSNSSTRPGSATVRVRSPARKSSPLPITTCCGCGPPNRTGPTGTGSCSAKSADLGHPLADFRAKYPERYVELGIAETNSVSVAAGLATCGYLPYIWSMSPFGVLKCAEQLRTDAAYTQLPVRLVAG